jgi:hypothetical protein
MLQRFVPVFGTISVALATACAGLDVENPNAPDQARALNDGATVKSLAIGGVNSWYLASTNIYPSLMLMVTADANTSNFCMGTRFSNQEPREPYANSGQGQEGEVSEGPWRLNYETLATANDVLRALDAGVEIPNGETEKYRVLAMFSQAASLSNLALLFDSAFVADEKSSPEISPLTLKRYTAVSTAALAKWDALIAHLEGRTDSYDASVLPVTTFPLTSANLKRVANTMAALTLRLTARTPGELTEMPTSFWQRLQGYASAGLTNDLTVQGDFNDWYSYIVFYGNSVTWMRVDYRKINRMDAAGGGLSPVPFRYRGTQDIRPPGHPTTNDQRLGDGGAGRDYQYLGVVLGDPSRGVFMQSAYLHARYSHHARDSETAGRTPVPYILKAENDLLLAEALVRSGGNRVTAAGLINNTRVGRGALTPLAGTESEATLLAAIDYERDVELANTNAFDLFYARSAPTNTPLGAAGFGGRIQPGTVRHLPVPARELELMGKKVYTYGGFGQPELSVIGASGERLRLRAPVRSSRPTAFGIESCPGK